MQAQLRGPHPSASGTVPSLVCPGYSFPSPQSLSSIDCRLSIQRLISVLLTWGACVSVVYWFVLPMISLFVFFHSIFRFLDGCHDFLLLCLMQSKSSFRSFGQWFAATRSKTPIKPGENHPFISFWSSYIWHEILAPFQSMWVKMNWIGHAPQETELKFTEHIKLYSRYKGNNYISAVSYLAPPIFNKPYCCLCSDQCKYRPMFLCNKHLTCKCVRS